MHTSSKSTFFASALVAALILLAGAWPAQAQQQGGGGASQAAVQEAARQAFRGADLEGKDGPFAKVGMDLAQLYYEHRAFRQSAATAGPDGNAPGFRSEQTMLPVRAGYVRIDAVAAAGGHAPALRARLDALGLERGATAGPLVSGWLPVEALAEAAQLEALRFARPSLAMARGSKTRGWKARSNAGRSRRQQEQDAPVVSQGVRALRAEQAREQFGTEGDGVLVGILSDSFDCEGDAAGDEAEGELPPDIIVVADEEECSSGTDEGRAMAQIVFDVAPEAGIAFNSAFNGRADFAESIGQLADEGAGVIVDDVIYFAEPMFAEGVVAQAASDIFDQGVAYFSSAGNAGGQSYESDDGFRETDEEGPLEGGPLHDFDPGSGVDPYQEVSLPNGASVTISLQWPEPYPSAGSSEGASSDLDIALVDANGDVVAEATFTSVMDDGTGNDPVEVFQYENDGSVDANSDGVADTTFSLAIELVEGPPPEDLLKYIYSSEANEDGEAFALQEYDAPHSTVYGHVNARGAEAVGASSWFNTPAFNEEREAIGAQALDAAIATDFSALGGTPIYFDADGSRFPAPEVRAKPEVTGPDGGDNSFFGQELGEDPFAALGDDTSVPNFFGTSAAAPHVAGVAALMRSLNADLSAARLYQILQNTAGDMTPESVPVDRAPGDLSICEDAFDFKTGCGFVDAVAALGEVPVTLQLLSEVVTAEDGGSPQVALSVTTARPDDAERFVVARCFGTRAECGTDPANYEEVQTLAATGQTDFTVTADVPTRSGTYTFLVRQENGEGAGSLLRTAEVTLELAEGTFELTEAFPTPFQNRTELRLVVGADRTVDVTATLYDALGRRVRTVFEGQIEGQGIIPLQAESLSSGVYFVRVESTDFVETRSLVLVR